MPVISVCIDKFERGNIMFDEAMYEIDAEIREYNQNEIDHYLYEEGYAYEYDSSESILSHEKTIGGVKL